MGKDGRWYHPEEPRLSLQVFRVECQQNKTYRVLSVREGDKEVQLWQERFHDLARKQSKND